MSYESTLREFETRLGRFVKEVTSLPTIFEYSSSQKKQEQFAQIYIGQVVSTGWEHQHNELSPDDKIITSKEYEVFVDISVHRATRDSSTQAKLGEVIHQLSTSSGVKHKYFIDEQFGFLRNSTIRKRFTQVDGIQYEERSSVQVVFNMIVQSEDLIDVGTVEEIQIPNITTKATKDIVVAEDDLIVRI